MRTRDDSDEAYVVGLCSQVLGETALTQHKFDGLQGDPGTGGRLAELPVDVYWPGHQLVVEYRELQHDQPMLHFDKPDRLTVARLTDRRLRLADGADVGTRYRDQNGRAHAGKR
jgi:hypothetical protein